MAAGHDGAVRMHLRHAWMPSYMVVWTIVSAIPLVWYLYHVVKGSYGGYAVLYFLIAIWFVLAPASWIVTGLGLLLAPILPTLPGPATPLVLWTLSWAVTYLLFVAVPGWFERRRRRRSAVT